MEPSFLRRIQFAFWVAWLRTVGRYRGTLLGVGWHPFLNLIFALLLVFVFHSSNLASAHKHLPYVLTGIVFMVLLSDVLMNGANVFLRERGLISSTPVDFTDFFLLCAASNCLTLLINSPLLVLAALLSDDHVNVLALFVFIALLWGFSIVTCIILGYACLRFRDLRNLLQIFLRLIFFITPVFWRPGPKSPHLQQILAEFNPFSHVLSLLRAGTIGAEVNVAAALMLCLFCALCIGASRIIHLKAKPHIVYWLDRD